MRLFGASSGKLSRTRRQIRFGKMRGGIVAVVVSAAVIALAGLATARAAESYHQLKKYNFPAAEGSTREYFDYIMVDSAARRVYLSHGTEIKVIDADNGSVVGTIGGLKLTHGVAVADEFGRGFITDGEQGKVIIFDPKTLKVIGEAKADKDADSVVYDPASRRVFVMNGENTPRRRIVHHAVRVLVRLRFANHF